MNISEMPILRNLHYFNKALSQEHPSEEQLKEKIIEVKRIIEQEKMQ